MSDVDPDLGVTLYRPANSSASFALPVQSDALDTAGASALFALTAQSTNTDSFIGLNDGDVDAATATDDDDFDFEVITSPEAIAAAASAAATTIITTRSNPVPSGAEALVDICTGTALSAISAVRAAIAAEDAAAIAREADAREQRVLSLIRLAVAIDENGEIGGDGTSGRRKSTTMTIEEGNEDEEEEEEEGKVVVVVKEESTVKPTLSHLSSEASTLETAAQMLDEAFNEASTTAAAARMKHGGPLSRGGIDSICDSAAYSPSSSSSNDTGWPTLTGVEAALTAQADLAPFHAGITVSAPDPSATCWSRLFAVSLKPSLESSRDSVFALARRPYDPHGTLQPELMAALYERLCGKSSSAAGAAWTMIGFQRENDFTTDLRGVGMFGPYQVYAALERHASVIERAWKIANNPMQGFPFMVQCFSLSAKTLHALRIGKLARSANEMANNNTTARTKTTNIVLRIADDFFASLLLAFTHTWHADPQASIMRLGHIQLDVVTRALAAPEDMLKRLYEWESAEERRRAKFTVEEK